MVPGHGGDSDPITCEDIIAGGKAFALLYLTPTQTSPGSEEGELLLLLSLSPRLLLIPSLQTRDFAKLDL